MKKIFHLPLAAALVFLAASCSTKNLEPEIGAFGSSVDLALKSAEKEIKDMKLEQRLRDDRILALVQANGFYQLGCDGSYVDSFEVDHARPEQVYLTKRCPLDAFDTNADSFKYNPTERELGEAVQARRVIAPLRKYAVELENLSNSKAPEEVSKKFTAASKALRELAKEASTLGGGAGIDSGTQKIIETGSGLAAILAREGLEAMRYSALKGIVTNGDEAVHGAGVIIARWMQSREALGLEQGMERVRNAEEAATESRFAGDRDGMQASYGDLVSAYEAALKADNDARWRAFIGMVIAHKALKEAFDKPADFARLQAAHDRLSEFVDQALKLKAALEAAG